MLSRHDSETGIEPPPALDVVNDQRGDPTYAVDLAKATMNCAAKTPEELFM